jgi:hypothetical protein
MEVHLPVKKRRQEELLPIDSQSRRRKKKMKYSIPEGNLIIFSQLKGFAEPS